MRWLALLLVACSSAPTPDAEPARAAQDGGSEARVIVDPRAYVIGDKSPLGPIPGQCVPGCKLAFPTTSNATSMHCYQLGDGACQSEPPGWFLSVPLCGQVGLWLDGCAWTGSYCTGGELFEGWNACVP